MRTRRRSQIDSADSFDLFLDTITNTFGGVLLLALLMVMLIRESSQVEVVEEGVTHASASELREKIEVLEAVKVNLVVSLQISDRFSSAFDDTESKELADELSALMNQEFSLSQQLDEFSQKTQSLIDRKKKGQQAVDDLQAKIEIEMRSLDQKLQQLAAEQGLRTRTMSLPKERVTSKSMTVALVKNDRMYVLDRSRGQLSFELNSEQFAKCSKSAADVVLFDGDAFQVKKDTGIMLTGGTLDSEFQKFDSSNFVAFAVWPDSFSNFKNIREACVKNGLEYKVIPVESGPIHETRSSSPSTSQ